MLLLLIRHAESEGNAARVIQGTADLPLTARGDHQAALLAARLAADPGRLDAIYASPLQRAWRTAEAIGAACGVAVRPLPGVREYDFGVGNGMTMREALEDYAVRDAGGIHGQAHLVFPGEEGRERFRDRVCGAIWALEAAHAEQTVAVVAHGGPIAAFCLTALGIADRRRPPFRIDNASITALVVHAGAATLLALNDRCHLLEVASPAAPTVESRLPPASPRQ